MSSDSRTVAYTPAPRRHHGIPPALLSLGYCLPAVLPLHLEDMGPLLSGLACVGRGTGIMFYPPGKPSISRREQ